MRRMSDNLHPFASGSDRGQFASFLAKSFWPDLGPVHRRFLLRPPRVTGAALSRLRRPTTTADKPPLRSSTWCIQVRRRVNSPLLLRHNLRGRRGTGACLGRVGAPATSFVLRGLVQLIIT